jgi:acyl-CoA synthetase (AMP-forming)/AMP-acid ligase II/3-oxoacyl-(acyl-carrier-protein) synthase/acyl carrier protein
MCRAYSQPHRLAYAFLHNTEVQHSLTYEVLARQARIIAAQLIDHGATGPVLLSYPPGLDFIAAFFGCLYAGVIAVPLYPPRRNRPDSRLSAIVADSQAAVGLTASTTLADIRRAQEPASTKLHWIATDVLPTDRHSLNIEPRAGNEAAAYLQYTSGSTSTPKGVMVTHSGLLHTLRDLDAGYRHDTDSVMVSWLPLFHDMGLIYGMLQPLHGGFPCYMMDPAAFLQRPSRWLQAISRYGGTHSAAPNFAFDLCARSVDQAEKACLDLRRWRVALNAAEPVRAETLTSFAAAFAGSGFATRSFCPGYGLAESTLKVTAVRRDTEPTLLRVQGRLLALGRVVDANAGECDARELVGCGLSEIDARIAIVGPETLVECAPARVGEIWVRSESVARGYWKRPAETDCTFAAHLADTGEGPFLRTGDLGFVHQGEVFVTGRLKDMVIVRGVNHYPQDIELSVERCHPALRPGAGAAFSVENGDEEGLVIVHEIERAGRRHVDYDAVIQAIRAAVTREHDLAVHAVTLLRPASVPKTSSGKIQRYACRQEFLSGSLQVVAEWRQAAGPAATAADLSSSVGTPEVAQIRHWIVGRLAERLNLAPAQLDAHAPFAVLGLDSLSTVRLSGELEQWLGRELSSTLLFDHPSPDALARYLARPVQSSLPARHVGPVVEPIAVIGIGCRFPGAADIGTFWRALRAGVDSVGPAPAGRWSAHGRAGAIPGHFLDAIDRFDADFFGISPREAQSMDPQQRLLLEVAWEAIENAGLVDLAGSPTGVFVGISSSDYARLLLRSGEADAYAGTGGALSIAANRISYLFDLRGPSWAVDTACSSSLVALHNACQALRLRECDLALAGGVNLMASPELTGVLYDAHMLAPDGRCKAFDESADGYGRGEGCGVVILKRHADALRDGDNILALVLGSAVSQDGRSNGLTAPSGLAQQQVIRRALDNAGVEPADIAYVETHGTGTSLGDPIEIGALTAVLADGRMQTQPCRLGSVKTGIGHLEAAAGIAGFIKTVLALRHGELPPHLHLRRLNPHIRLESTPFSIPTVLEPWPPAGPRRVAGVSSFGFGGTNAHVIVSEAERAGAGAAVGSEGPHLLTLSAKHPVALREIAAAYASWLDAHPDASLGDVCCTAAIARVHFRHRCAVVAESLPELRLKLAAVAAGASVVDVAFGEALASSAELVADTAGTLIDLADLYARGADVNWRAFYRDHPHQRLVLPSYRFQRQQFWVPDAAHEAAAAANAAQPSTQVVRLLEQGDAEALARLVAESAQLSAEQTEIAQTCMRDLVARHHNDARQGAVPSIDRGHAAARVEHPTPIKVGESPGELRRRLDAVESNERRHLLVSYLQGEIAELLQLDQGRLPDLRRGLFDMGFDSLMALELRDRLDCTLGTKLSPTLAFDCPSVAILAEHLLELFALSDAAVAQTADDSCDERLAEVCTLSEAELGSLVDEELQRALN